MPHPNTANEGAADTRDRIRAYLNNRMEICAKHFTHADGHELYSPKANEWRARHREAADAWVFVNGLAARANAKPGGLGRKKRVKP